MSPLETAGAGGLRCADGHRRGGSATARVEAGSGVAAIGCGVGLNVIQGARLVGAARIIAVDRPAALALAREFGATETLDSSYPAAGDVARAIRKLSGCGADYAFEVVGRPETIATAWESLAPGGTAVVVGLTKQNGQVTLRSDFLSEKKLLGCIFGSSVPRVDVPRVLELYRLGRLKLEELGDAALPAGRGERGAGGAGWPARRGAA